MAECRDGTIEEIALHLPATGVERPRGGDAQGTVRRSFEHARERKRRRKAENDDYHSGLKHLVVKGM
jgi:hypothetical protein